MAGAAGFMAAAAAADAVGEVADVRSPTLVRCGEVWLYISFAASVASGDTTCEPCEDDVKEAPDWALLVVPLLPALRVRSLIEDAFSWRVFFVDLIPSRIWFATAIDMPQKSGTRCTHWA
jgi:hypothetical protein